MQRIRLEWGAYMPYVQHPSHLSRIDWSGSLSVREGNVLKKERYRFESTGFGPGREVRSGMKTGRWPSSPPNEIHGVILEVRTTPRTAISARFRWGTCSFKVSEFKRSPVLEWPAGPKYCLQSFRAYLDGDDPFEDGFPDDPLPEACKPAPDVAIPARGFKDARCFHSYYLREAAWVGQMGDATAGFRLDSPGRRYLLLHLMLGPPYAVKDSPADKIDRTIRFEVLINGRSLGVRERFFSFFRSVQKVEEVAMDVPGGFLHKGLNRISVRNHDHVFHLLVLRAEFRPEPLRDELLSTAMPGGYYCGFDTNTVAPENREEFAERLRYIGDPGPGSFVLLRPEGSLIHADDIDGWIRTFRERQTAFAYLSDETGCTKKIQEAAGPLFLGQMFHEVSHCPNQYSYPAVMRTGRPTMKSAYGEYLEYVKRIVKRVKTASPETRVILGEGQQHVSYDYLAGADIVLAEVNVWHVGFLLAASRGAHRTLGKRLSGAHVAGGCFKHPMLLDAERMYETTLHACYLHGVRLLYDEESALSQTHGRPYSFNSRFCRGRRALLGRYKRFIEQHADPGEPVVNCALMLGRFECPPFSHGEKVWSQFGGEDEAWDRADPEAGWELADVFLPGMWMPGHAQDWKKLRLWHSGTPLGQFDIVSSGITVADMQRYRSIIFPGWNSMNRELYGKLAAYVRTGGILFMAMPQLSGSVDRESLKRMDERAVFNGGDLRDLFGVRVGKGSCRSGRITFKKGTPISRSGKSYRVTPEVRNSRVEVADAQVLAADGSGRPVLVEKRSGKGIARLLTLQEYPGARPLRRMMRDTWKALAGEVKGDTWVEDPSGEVAWYVFDGSGERHLWLLNTDWVSSGNVKEVTVHTGGTVKTVAVRQGRPVRIRLTRREKHGPQGHGGETA